MVAFRKVRWLPVVFILVIGLVIAGCDDDKSGVTSPSTLADGNGTSGEGEEKIKLDQAEVKKLFEDLMNEGDRAKGSFEALSPVQQKAVIEALKVKEVKEEVENDPSDQTEDSSAKRSRCRGITLTRTAYNVFRWRLWSYKQYIRWCYDGRKVSYKYRRRWGET